MTLIAPLNLEYWLVNVFAGNIMLFFAIGIIFLSYAAAKFRMASAAFGVIALVFLYLVMPTVGTWLVVIVGILTTIIVITQITIKIWGK